MHNKYYDMVSVSTPKHFRYPNPSFLEKFVLPRVAAGSSILFQRVLEYAVDYDLCLIGEFGEVGKG